MLLTARDDFGAMKEAFDQGVDDFLNKANLRSQLLPRIVAAERIAARQNELLRANKLLRKRIRELQRTDLVDPLTGLGNMKFTLERVDAVIRQAETRGGAACIVLVGVNNLGAVEERYDSSVKDELVSALAAKLRGLVRPLDLVTRPEPDMFAVITLQPSLESCTAASFKRIFDGLYMHSIKTSDGFIPVVTGVSVCAADESTGFPNPKHLLKYTFSGLAHSFATGGIHATHFDIAKVPDPAVE
jgi:diguanylate cyclase (GGDEF)-like protein